MYPCATDFSPSLSLLKLEVCPFVYFSVYLLLLYIALEERDMDMISKNFQQDAMFGDEMIRHFFFSAPEAIHIFFSPVHSSSRIHSCVLYVLYI